MTTDNLINSIYFEKASHLLVKQLPMRTEHD